MAGWFISALAGRSNWHGAGVWLIHHHHRRRDPSSRWILSMAITSTPTPNPSLSPMHNPPTLMATVPPTTTTSSKLLLHHITATTTRTAPVDFRFAAIVPDANYSNDYLFQPHPHHIPSLFPCASTTGTERIPWSTSGLHTSADAHFIGQAQRGHLPCPMKWASRSRYFSCATSTSRDSSSARSVGPSPPRS